MTCRLLQNRESAQRFRVKRKNEFDVLREKVSELQTENSSLKSEVRLPPPTEVLWISYDLFIFEIPRICL